MLSVRGEPLFLADWLRPVFVHYEVPAKELQRDVPFELDLYQGKAYVIARCLHDAPNAPMSRRTAGRVVAQTDRDERFLELSGRMCVITMNQEFIF